MSDTAAIPFPPRSNDVDEVEETEEEIEETDDTEEVEDAEEETEEVDDEEETEAVAKPKAKKSKSSKPSKAKKGKPAKAKKKAKESFSAELAPGSIEIPETAGGTDPLRLELAEKVCKEDWQNCATLRTPLRCSSITARHYLYKAARLPGAQVQFRMTGKRGVPSLHVFIPTKKSKK